MNKTYNKTYNPCDDCKYSYSKNNQESEMCKICEFTYYINQAPKVGQWIEKPNPWGMDGSHTYVCSVCNEQISVLGNPLLYCSFCGAEMKEGV